VDEILEVDYEYCYLKEYARAFHHNSKSLKNLEDQLKQYGTSVGSNEMGSMALKILYPHIVSAKKMAVYPPSPKEECVEAVKKYVKPNSVLLTARARTCYGRNLPPSFYSLLIKSLIDSGHNIIWTGDETNLVCPDDGIFNFTKTPEANNIECTFALTSLVKASIQLFTASHRISGITGTPHIVVESTDQIFSETATGQEGYRMFLADRFDKRKLIISHFFNVLGSQDEAIGLIGRALKEIDNNDFSTIIGQVENPDYIKFLLDHNKLIINR
jgi:hypothetical protein